MIGIRQRTIMKLKFFFLLLLCNCSLNASENTWSKRIQKLKALFTCCIKTKQTDQYFLNPLWLEEEESNSPTITGRFEIPYWKFENQYELKKQERAVEAIITKALVDSLPEEERLQLERENKILEGPTESIIDSLS